jgi:hypothetical protein
VLAARREHTAVMREDVESALPRIVDVALRAVRVFTVEERALLAAHEAERERIAPGDLLRLVRGQTPAAESEADIVAFPASAGPGRQPE